MGLDIRLPMGLLFTILGALLVVYGFVSDPAIYERSLGYNVNLIWGSVMTVFGLGMWYFGQRATSRKARE